MHVYLPEKYRSPFLHGFFLFSKVGVLIVNIDSFFALAYSSHTSWSWPLGRTWCHHTLSSSLYLKDCQFCPAFFLRKGIMEPALPRVFDCPPTWSCPQVFNSGLGMRLNEGRFGFWQGVAEFFWNFEAIPDTKIILTSIQSKRILKKFKWFLWRGF